MKKQIIILISLIIYDIQGFSQENKQESYSFSLKQSIEYALQNASSLKNSELDERIAKEQVREIVGMGLPQLNASVDGKYFAKLPTSLIPAEFFGGKPGEYIAVSFGTKYNMTPSLDASQLIFDGSYLVGLQAAKVYMQMAQKMSESTKIEIVASISKAYYNILVNEEHAKILDINIERTSELMKNYNAMYDNGFIEKLDVDRITVAYNNLVSEKENMLKYIELNYHLLKMQMGMSNSSKLSLTDKIEDLDFKSIPLPSGKFDYTKKIDYSILQTAKTMKQLDVKRHKVSHLPSIVAYGSLSTQAQRNEFNFFNTDQNIGNKWFPIGVVGARINIPIFDGLQKLRKVNQANFELQKTENNINILSQAIDVEIESAKTNLLTSINRMETQKKNMELADEILRVVNTKYMEGVGSNIEVINAQASQKEARINYYSALYDATIAKINLEKATGTLVK